MPDDEALLAIVKEMGDVIGQVQAFGRRDSFILMEIVRDLARLQPNPQKYLAGLFERVSARADQGAVDDEAHPVNVEFRDAVARFFRLAGQKL